MKRGGKTILWVLGIGVLACSVQAVVNDDSSATGSANDGQTPYSAIWLRNVFDLKPPPPPAPPPDPKANTPPSNVKLTGITTIFGKAQALFLVQEPSSPGKPPAKEESFIMSAGERQGALEVLDIDTKTSMVKIRNDGQESTITFETNRPPAGGGPASMVSAPGAPPMPGTGVPVQRGPGPRPLGFQGGSPVSRPMRTSDAGAAQPGYAQPTGYAQPYQSGYVQAASATGASSGLNLGSLFNQPTTSSLPSPTTAPTTTPEESVAKALVYQGVNADGIRAGIIPPLPIPPGIPDPAAASTGNESASGAGSSSLVPTIPTTRTYPPGYRATGSLAQ